MAISETQQVRTYRALDMLLREHPPKVAGKVPYWRPPAAELGDEHGRIVPTWSWSRPITASDGDRVVQLDANAAYLSAISSVEVAHGPLARQRHRPFDPRVPGYWLITGHRWPLNDRIMSPLGTARLTDRVWVTTPTMQLLAQLVADGVWPDVTVYDAWPAQTACRLRVWAERMASDRRVAMAAGDAGRLAAVKLGYSQAVTLLGTDEKSRAYRPDWADHIRAQHAATLWRKAWRVDQAGLGHLVRAGTVDELVYPEKTVRELQARTARGQVLPVRIDQSGRTLGTFKVKGQWPTRRTVKRAGVK